MRLEHSNTYVLTEDGQRFAVFYTKVHNRLLRPLMAADQPPAPIEVRQALHPRPGRHRLHRPSPNRRLKSRLKCQTPSDQGPLGVQYGSVMSRKWNQVQIGGEQRGRNLIAASETLYARPIRRAWKSAASPRIPIMPTMPAAGTSTVWLDVRLILGHSLIRST